MIDYFSIYGVVGVIVTGFRHWLLTRRQTPTESLLKEVDAINNGTHPWMHEDGRVPLYLRVCVFSLEVFFGALSIIVWPFVLYRLVVRQRNLMREKKLELDLINEELAAIRAHEKHVKRMSIAEIEARETFAECADVPALPFGFLNPGWLRFKSQIQTGDEIWLFEFTPFANQPFAAWRQGAEGYVLLRDGTEVARYLSNAG